MDDSKISMRFVQRYDIQSDQPPTRMDCYAVTLGTRSRWRRAMMLPSTYRKMRAIDTHISRMTALRFAISTVLL